MENLGEYGREFDNTFAALKKQVDESFLFMHQHPEKKNEMVDLWKSHILQFVSHTYKTSEKYNNKDVFKAISKALMFGR